LFFARLVLRGPDCGALPLTRGKARTPEREEPWQVPELQPAFIKTGMTSSLKLIADGRLELETVTGMARVCPAKLTSNFV